MFINRLVLEDCCDGSDEYNGRVTCVNTCQEQAAKMREEEEKLKRIKEEGVAKKKELIDAAEQLKQSLQVAELERAKILIPINMSKKVIYFLLLANRIKLKNWRPKKLNYQPNV